MRDNHEISHDQLLACTLLILQPFSYLRALQIRLGAKAYLSFQHPLEFLCTQVWSRWDQTFPYLACILLLTVGEHHPDIAVL